ncbi:uncharacterized protein LOC125196515 isoform X1 [Salvia hispanica]|uniref:uncharacterized protein LOC125196515 isoform X1 n=1 Tax=Salvia hispanica TaxID=49212 RepID=UPI002009023A|nr:uncharacterized protein LOC125196515 isoform X1 [Salvia hispanica]
MFTRGTKRAAISESAQFSESKRVTMGSPLDALKPDQSSPQLPLDAKRAESSKQHVRALNTQFASWVQAQLKNHPDELWEDGAQDYLNHAKSIMDKFTDVVNWLKANAAKGESPGELRCNDAQTKPTSDVEKSSPKLVLGKPGFPSFSSALSPSSGSWNFGNDAQSKPASGIDKSSQSLVWAKPGIPESSVATTPSLGISPPADAFNKNSSFSFGGASKPASGIDKNGQNLFSGKPGNPESSVATTPSFGNWPPGNAFNKNSPFSFGGNQLATGNSHAVPLSNATSGEADGDEDVEQPSSPSVKKSQEEGIVLVHEVKCKLYVKSSDPEDKGDWKDKGVGQLNIKCKEGISKGTKESKPVIVIRNDVGKLLLNASLYPGIKTSKQKNSVVAIFHTKADDDNNDAVIARTFLMRTKTEEDRDKLAAAIQEYAPAG